MNVSSEPQATERDKALPILKITALMLMVCLILAITIPSLLGVTSHGRGHARTNVEHAMSAATVAYSSNSPFAGTPTEATTLANSVGGVTFITASSHGTSTISVDVVTSTTLVLAALDKSSHVCWMVATNESTSVNFVNGAPSGTSVAEFRATEPTACGASVITSEWKVSSPDHTSHMYRHAHTRS